jgi:hypothetical protein
MREKGKMITVSLGETTAALLALFCKRAIIEWVGPFAAGEAEAHEMMEALDDLRHVLKEQGFSPR